MAKATHPQNITRPHFMGDQGTWDQRGPVGVVEPMPNPPWIGTTEIFTESVGMAYIRTQIYHASYIAPNGLAPFYTPPTMGTIGPYGQALSPDVENIDFYGSGG